jgi:hypothetical protein
VGGALLRARRRSWPALGFAFREPLRGEERRRDGGIDVDHREWGAGLEHGVQRRLPVAAPTVADRGGDSHDQGRHEPGDHRGEGTFPTREHEVDLRPIRLQPMHGGEETMKSGDTHIVRPDDVDAELEEDGSRLFREWDIARSRGEDRRHAVAVSPAERPGKADDTAAGEEPKARTGPARGAPRLECPELCPRGPRNEGAQMAFGKGANDAEQVLHAFSLAQDHLGNPDPTCPVSVETRVVPDVQRLSFRTG